jgi:cobalt-zinc-cadmium efflux system protein
MNHARFNPSCCSYHQATNTPQKLRSLGVALVLIISFAAVELGIAGICHSVALLAEAGHMLSDGLSLGLALLALWIAQRSPSPQATFGHRRIEILAALLNSIGLLGIAVWISWEAVTHFQSVEPSEILSVPMLLTALIGLVVNGINVVLLHQDSQHDLNLRGAWLHMLADVVSSIGVMVAALLIWALGWQWADGIISLVVASLIAVTAVPLIRQSLQILLEQAPPHLNLDQIKSHLHSFEGVVAVHNLRVWTIALGQDALSAHLTVHFSEGSKRDRLLQQIQLSLQSEFGIAETFLQLSAGMPLELMPSLVEQIEQVDGQRIA